MEHNHADADDRSECESGNCPTIAYWAAQDAKANRRRRIIEKQKRSEHAYAVARLWRTLNV